MADLRVLTVNIWNRQGPWDERLPLLRRGVADLAPDVVGLQEVIEYEGHTQAQAIGADHPVAYHHAFGVANEWGGGVRFGNAVLSRFPILQTEVRPLPKGGSRESRSILFAALETPDGPLPFFVTHLNWKFHEGVVREAQVLEVAAFVKEKAPIDGLPPILVGDFNAEPEAAEIRFLKGLQSLGGRSVYFADAFGLVGEGRGITFDAARNPHAAVTREPPRRIDYVFVRGPDQKGRGIPRAARVVYEDVVAGVAASDHYGVLATVDLG